MEPPNEDQRLIERYLLGDLTLEEQREFEQHLFSDEHLLSQLNRIENELTDQYVRGELLGTSKAQFERHFMRAPERRESVVFARALNSYVSAKEQSRLVSNGLEKPGFDVLPGVVARPRPLFHISLAAAAVIFGMLFVWLFLNRAQLRRELEQARTAQAELQKREEDLRRQFEEQRIEADRLARELEREKEALTNAKPGVRPPQPDSTTGDESSLGELTFLFSGSSRGQDDGATVRVSHGEKYVRLALMIDREPYVLYKVAVTTIENRQEVWNRAGLKAIRTRNGMSVITSIPVANLTMSDYRIELYGEGGNRTYEKAGYYIFRIDKN